jgi:hypothetical protein
MPWKMAYIKSGILGEPRLGAPRTPFRPNDSRFPMNPLVAVCEKVNEYPQKNHWKLTTAADMTDSHNSDSADFLRASPE